MLFVGFAISATLWGVKGNVRTSSKLVGKCVADFLFVFCAKSYGSDVISKYWSKSAIFQSGVGNFKRKFQVEGNIVHQPLLVLEN